MTFGVMGRRSYGPSELWAVGIKTRTRIQHTATVSMM